MTAHSNPGHQSRSGTKPRLLIVDDEPSILYALRVVFRGHYDVTATTNGSEALAMLSARPFDVIVSDQQMPGMTGVELLRQARELAPNTVRVLMTARDHVETVPDNDAKVYRFLNKPWDNVEIKRVMDEAVGLARSLESVPGADTATGPAMSRAQIIPLPLQHATNAAAVVPSGRPAGRETVLIASGDISLAKQIQAALGQSVSQIPVANMLDVFRVLDSTPISVIVCYLDAHSEVDRTFIQMVKRDHPAIPVIAVCDSTDSMRLVELMNQARIFRFVKTPVNPALLARYVGSAIRLAAVQKNSAIGQQTPAGESPPATIANEGSLRCLEQLAAVRKALAKRSSVLLNLLRPKR